MRIHADAGLSRVELGSAQLGDAITLALRDQSRAQRWRLTVRVRTALGWATLGAVETRPATTAATETRIVAIAHCPGAEAWAVDAEPLTASDAVAELTALQGALAAAPGRPLAPVEPHAVLVGERYSQLAATLPAGTTMVTIPDGATVRSISAWQSGTGTIIRYPDPTMPPVHLPEDGAVTLTPGGTIPGGLVRFSNVPATGGAYVVELAS